MKRQQERLIYLLAQYKNSSCTQVEKNELMEIIRQPEMEEFVKELIQQEAEQIDDGKLAIGRELSDDNAQKIFDKIIGSPELSVEPPVVRHLWWKLAAAAILLFVIAGIYLAITKNDNREMVKTEQADKRTKDVAPGGNKAILTLADGSTILLDSAANGILARQGNARVLKTSNGQLAYDIGPENSAVPLINTLSTPPGGQYQLILPDGTKVWLNATSSLSYPTAFTGKERRVEVTGEAYFEVARNKDMPFKVVVNKKQEVIVLGTHFNINAYSDELFIKTTLLEGSVQVLSGNDSGKLSPGQQSALNVKGAFEIVDHVNVGAVIAWKNGYFQFVKADVKTVMRQLARWYDVDVEYKGDVTEELFGGKLERNLTLSQVLKVLESIGLHYELKERKLIVRQADNFNGKKK